MKYKKMTKKEIESEFQNINKGMNYLFQKLNSLEHYVYSLGKVFDSYVKFSGNEKEFKKHMEKIKIL